MTEIMQRLATFVVGTTTIITATATTITTVSKPPPPLPPKLDPDLNQRPPNIARNSRTNYN
jgi:hypothetical protein